MLRDSLSASVLEVVGALQKSTRSGCESSPIRVYLFLGGASLVLL